MKLILKIINRASENIRFRFAIFLYNFETFAKNVTGDFFSIITTYKVFA